MSDLPSRVYPLEDAHKPHCSAHVVLVKECLVDAESRQSLCDKPYLESDTRRSGKSCKIDIKKQQTKYDAKKSEKLRTAIAIVDCW